MADPIKVWPNDAQQLFEMNQDLASVNAAGVESDGQLAFFVGKPTTGNQWTLKKITPNELGKLVYDYLTSSSIASQLASVLGGVSTTLTASSNLDNTKKPGVYIAADNVTAQTISGTFPLPSSDMRVFRLEVTLIVTERPIQKIFINGNKNYIRNYTGSEWTAWSSI